MKSKNKRIGITRYEGGERVPKDDRLLEIANKLNVNGNYSKMNIDFAILEYFRNDRDNLILKFMESW